MPERIVNKLCRMSQYLVERGYDPRTGFWFDGDARDANDIIWDIVLNAIK